MESPRFRLLPLLGAALLLLLPLLGARAQEDAELQPRALDIYSAVEDASHEKELEPPWLWVLLSVPRTGCLVSTPGASQGGVCVVLGLLITHLGWTRTQGGNFGLWGGGVLQIEALQEVLKKLKSKRIPIYEKKYGQVPMCDAGEKCAVRKGARIGKLCDCPRGTSCNSFLLKCL